MQPHLYLLCLAATLQTAAAAPADAKAHPQVDRYRPGEVNMDDLKSSPTSQPLLGKDGVLRIVEDGPGRTVLDYIQLDPEQFHTLAQDQLNAWERFVANGGFPAVPKEVQDLTELKVDGRKVQDEDQLWTFKRRERTDEEKERLRWSRQQKARRDLSKRIVCNFNDLCDTEAPDRDCVPFDRHTGTGCEACLAEGESEIGICTRFDRIPGFDSIGNHWRPFIGGVIKGSWRRG